MLGMKGHSVDSVSHLKPAKESLAQSTLESKEVWVFRNAWSMLGTLGVYGITLQPLLFII